MSCTIATVLHGWCAPSAGVSSAANARFPTQPASQPQSAGVRPRVDGFVSSRQGQDDSNARPPAGEHEASRLGTSVSTAYPASRVSPVAFDSRDCFTLQIGVNYSDSDQPIGGVVGDFSSMMQFWADYLDKLTVGAAVLKLRAAA